jgi:hypothetical protein
VGGRRERELEEEWLVGWKEGGDGENLGGRWRGGVVGDGWVRMTWGALAELLFDKFPLLHAEIYVGRFASLRCLYKNKQSNVKGSATHQTR